MAEDRSSRNTGLFREPGSQRPGSFFTSPRWLNALILLIAGLTLCWLLFFAAETDIVSVPVWIFIVLSSAAELLPRSWTTLAGILRLSGVIAFASGIIIFMMLGVSALG